MAAQFLYAGAINDRDRRIFQFLFENKVATARQLKDIFFAKNCPQIAYRRLASLSNAGWLRKEGHAEGTKLHHIYGLSDKAYQDYVFNEEVNGRQRQLKSSSVDHDLALVDIRQCFQKNQAVKRFYPENLLQSAHKYAGSEEFRDCVALRSDAVVELLMQGKYRFLVPIEYEASFKELERCHQKLLNYYIKYDGDVVFFICRNDAIRKRFVKIEQELSHQFKPKVYFGLLSDVQKSPTRLTFVKAKGDQYTIE